MEQEIALSIRQELKRYADRGVFRSYSDSKVADGKYEFRFSWLASDTIRLVYSQSQHRLLISQILPAMDKPSVIDRELRRFLQRRHAKTLPSHRRIDKGKIKLSCLNKGDSISIALKITLGTDCSYVVNRTVNLISDIFHGFLRQPECIEYVRKNFGIPGE